MILRLFWIRRTVWESSSSDCDRWWWRWTSCRRSASWSWSESWAPRAARKGIYVTTGCKCCCCGFCVCDCSIYGIFRCTQAAIFFSLWSIRSVRSLLLITSTKHRAFIQFDCLSAGVWWRVSHQEVVEQQLPTNNEFHDWLICRWLSWL